MSISLNNIESRVTTLENKSNTGVGIGYGQKWYDVTSKRTSGAYYTNTTGQPIMVNVYDCQDWQEQQIYVDDVKVASHGGSSSEDITISAIVPVGSKYKVVNYDKSVQKWLELRSNNM